MKTHILTITAALLCLCSCSQKEEAGSYPISSVPFTQVKIDTDSFWGDRLSASREVTIPLAFSKCEESGRYTNFENAATKLEAKARGEEGPTYLPGGFPFDDTDVYKTIEGASYLLQTYPDPKLEAYIDSVLNIVKAAQEEDGYLYTPRTQNPEKPHPWVAPGRWNSEEAGSHELYNLGHMVEGAIAHYQATGSRKFLDIAIAYADCVCREIGYGSEQRIVVPGHQIAEMALAKLYTVTGDKKYLDEAKLFLDNKGYTSRKEEYDQSHKPVIEQDEAVGHAVRAGYMYAGMADVAALTGDISYVNAIDRIWENIVSQKLYLTGGIGSTGRNEGFSPGYDLPNLTAYCETCAAIALVYVNYRLFLLHGEGKYFDVLERSLYNGVISGVSLDGGSFFYPNPLESDGSHERQPWFGCACCPSNICRFIPSVPGYAYAKVDNTLYVNLFMQSAMSTKLKSGKVELEQKTAYPWDGNIELTVKKAPSDMDLKIRIPGWVRGDVVPSDLYTYADGKSLGFRIAVNGYDVNCAPVDGYCTISRKWKAGDVVSIEFEMEPRLVEANPAVEADRDRLAVERGPIVYCAEWADNTVNVLDATISSEAEFSVIPSNFNIKDKKYSLYEISDSNLTLIPYYAWAHRGKGNMEVWIKKQ